MCFCQWCLRQVAGSMRAHNDDACGHVGMRVLGIGLMCMAICMDICMAIDIAVYMLHACLHA